MANPRPDAPYRMILRRQTVKQPDRRVHPQVMPEKVTVRRNRCYVPGIHNVGTPVVTVPSAFPLEIEVDLNSHECFRSPVPSPIRVVMDHGNPGFQRESEFWYVRETPFYPDRTIDSLPIRVFSDRNLLSYSCALL